MRQHRARHEPAHADVKLVSTSNAHHVMTSVGFGGGRHQGLFPYDLLPWRRLMGFFSSASRMFDVNGVLEFLQRVFDARAVV